MRSYVLTEAANKDIHEIWSWIARDSLEHAADVEAAIIENCELLAASPTLGHRRRDLTGKDLLFWPTNPYKNYFLVYDAKPDQIRIVRVIHAARRRVWRTI